jgi:hypothetical protein
VADEFIKTGFGLSGLEAASAGAFNPDYGYTPYVQNQYNHMNMNTVSIQCLAVDRRSLTYLVVLQNPNAAWLASPVGRIPPCFQLVLTLPKAPTDSDTIASPTSDVPWDGNLLPPTLSAPEPQHVSGIHPVTARILNFTPFLGLLCFYFRGSGTALCLLTQKWPGTSNQANSPIRRLRSLMVTARPGGA